MIKYICVNKESKRVYVFFSFLDKLSNKYRIANIDEGEILSNICEDEKMIEDFLKEKYEIKIKK